MIPFIEKTAASKSRNSGNRAPSIGNRKLKQLYATMLQCRMLAEREREICEQRGWKTRHGELRGKEAAVVGCAVDLESEDTLAHPQGHLFGSFIRGAGLTAAFSHLDATKDDSAFRLANSVLNFPPPVLEAEPEIVMQAALANQQRGRKRRAVVAFIDGRGASMKPWRETFQTAAARKLAILFVAQRNPAGSATSGNGSGNVRHELEHRDFPTIPVDGNDVVAVYRVTQEAVKRARQGGGPTLMECMPFLPCGGPRRKRPPVSDPICRMEEYLLGRGLFREDWKNQLTWKFAGELDAASSRLRFLSKH